MLFSFYPFPVGHPAHEHGNGILKHNLKIDVNRRFSPTWCVALYVDMIFIKFVSSDHDISSLPCKCANRTKVKHSAHSWWRSKYDSRELLTHFLNNFCLPTSLEVELSFVSCFYITSREETSRKKGMIGDVYIWRERDVWSFKEIAYETPFRVTQLRKEIICSNLSNSKSNMIYVHDAFCKKNHQHAIFHIIRVPYCE